MNIDRMLKGLYKPRHHSMPITQQKTNAKRNNPASSLFDTKINKILGKKLMHPKISLKPSKKDWDGDGIPNNLDCQPNNIMRQDSIFSFRKKKEPQKYTSVTDPKFREEEQQKQAVRNLPNYGEVQNISGNKVGNVMIAADIIIPSGKTITLAGIGVKKYVDKVKLIKTDEQDKKYIIPRVEFHRK